jgi:hypothetical protein
MLSKYKSISILIALSLFLALASSNFLQPAPAFARSANSNLPSAADNGTNIHSALENQFAGMGLITGRLSYPSENIPPMTVVAMRIDNRESTYYTLDTVTGQASYAIRVDPGVYLVLAYKGDLAAGYTRYVTCGMGAACRDHILQQVPVEAGDIREDIDLLDWYAPRGSFPARPDRSSDPIMEPVCSTYHRVSWGETLYKIGLQYNLTWRPIASANHISDPNLIFAGQVLCIPKTSVSNSVQGHSARIPTIDIRSVVRNKQVSIQTGNFPRNTTFVVTMGEYGTKGIDGIPVAETNSGNGGSFNVTYSIPKTLRGSDRIAIRLQSASGYYSYNWFYNTTTW